MDKCKIIQDLLPGFCDGLISEETNELIRSHTASCPDCASILKKMSAEPPREVIDHREQFRRTLQQYQQRHRIRTLGILLACFIVLSLLLLGWCNSYTLSKWIADSKMQKSVSHLVYRSETESRYVYYTLGCPTLVTLAKNDALNCWYIAEIDDSPSHAWFGESNSRWFKGTEMTIDFESHYLYTGADAKAYIELESRDIPGAVLVEINQNGPNYWIHVVSCDPDAMNQLKLMQLLRDKGFIE